MNVTASRYPGAALRGDSLGYAHFAIEVEAEPELMVEAAHLHPEWLERLAQEDPEVYAAMGARRPDIIACCIAIRPELLVQECRHMPDGFLQQLDSNPRLLTQVAGFNAMAIVTLFVDQPQIIGRIASRAPAALELLEADHPVVMAAVRSHAQCRTSPSVSGPENCNLNASPIMNASPIRRST